MICINLRHVLLLDPVQVEASSSINKFILAAEFYGVTGNDVASPIFEILTDNFNVSREHNDFASHVNSAELVSSRFLSTPMVKFQGMI